MSYITLKVISKDFTVEFDSDGKSHTLTSEVKEHLVRFLKLTNMDSEKRLSEIEWDPGHTVLRLDAHDARHVLRVAGMFLED